MAAAAAVGVGVVAFVRWCARACVWQLPFVISLATLACRRACHRFPTFHVVFAWGVWCCTGLETRAQVVALVFCPRL
jgi:hypothetical protein